QEAVSRELTVYRAVAWQSAEPHGGRQVGVAFELRTCWHASDDFDSRRCRSPRALSALGAPAGGPAEDGHRPRALDDSRRRTWELPAGPVAARLRGDREVPRSARTSVEGAVERWKTVAVIPLSGPSTDRS